MLETVANQFDLNSTLLIIALIVSIAAPIVVQLIQNHNANKQKKHDEILNTMGKAFNEYLQASGQAYYGNTEGYVSYFAAHYAAYSYADDETRNLMDDALVYFKAQSSVGSNPPSGYIPETLGKISGNFATTLAKALSKK